MPGPAELAKRLIEVVPPLMQQIRQEMRAAAADKLTVPQYRILNNVSRGLNQVGRIANHHGISQPAMSKMVNGLVARGLLKRGAHPSDRRAVVLEMTGKGERLFQNVREAARVSLDLRLSDLKPGKKRQLLFALEQIDSLYDFLKFKEVRS